MFYSHIRKINHRMKRKLFCSLFVSIFIALLPTRAEDIHCTGIWVGGVELTSQNNYKVETSGMGLLQSGYAVYNPETKTLHLDQIKINTDGVYNAIELLNNDDITIECFGDCRFITRRAIYKPEGFGGTITLRYADNFESLPTKFLCTCTCSCIETPNDLYIYRIPVELSANCRYNVSPYNIAAIIARNVTVNYSPISLKANIQKAMQLIQGGKLRLINNHMVAPANTTTDSEGYVTFTDTPLEVRTELPVGRIGITIGETNVTADNQEDVRSNILKSGKITFVRSSSTLVLDNVVINDDAQTLDPYHAIIDVTNRSNFKIQLIGDNVIRSMDHRGILLFQSNNETEDAPHYSDVKKTRNTNATNRVTIFGDGTLTMQGKAGITAWQDLFLNNVNITMADSIVGVGKKKSAIEINASEIKTAGIAGFDSFKLTGCTIAAPANATYDENKCEMTVKGNVVITTGTTNIKPQASDLNAKQSGVFSIDGRKLQKDEIKGVVIENGVKKLRR